MKKIAVTLILLLSSNLLVLAHGGLPTNSVGNAVVSGVVAVDPTFARELIFSKARDWVSKELHRTISTLTLVSDKHDIQSVYSADFSKITYTGYTDIKIKHTEDSMEVKEKVWFTLTLNFFDGGFHYEYNQLFYQSYPSQEIIDLENTRAYISDKRGNFPRTLQPRLEGEMFLLNIFKSGTAKTLAAQYRQQTILFCTQNADEMSTKVLEAVYTPF